MGGKGSGRPPSINTILNRQRPEIRTPIGDDLFLPNHSGDHSQGNVRSTPVSDTDIANKKYVDDNIGGGSGDVTAGATTLVARNVGPLNDELLHH